MAIANKNGYSIAKQADICIAVAYHQDLLTGILLTALPVLEQDRSRRSCLHALSVRLELQPAHMQAELRADAPEFRPGSAGKGNATGAKAEGASTRALAENGGTKREAAPSKVPPCAFCSYYHHSSLAGLGFALQGQNQGISQAITGVSLLRMFRALQCHCSACAELALCRALGSAQAKEEAPGSGHKRAEEQQPGSQLPMKRTRTSDDAEVS